MTTPTFRKASLLAIAVSAALVACGGGGGGDSTPAATPTPTGTTTTATAPNGTTLTANTGTSSGRPDSEGPPITPGLPPAPAVPPANAVVTTAPAASYPSSAQSLNLFNAIQEWRALMRFEDENGGTPLGVGLLTQRPNLDVIAADLAANAPGLVTGTAEQKAAAVADAQARMNALSYAASYVAAVSTAPAGPLGIAAGTFCSKAIMSSLPGAEIGVSGMRFAGFFAPEASGGNCVMLAALDTLGSWQLPSTGSSSVYPFPGKQLTLPRYYGDWASLDPANPFTSQPGHAVYVSLASVDALPVAIPGAGSGVAISPSAIRINELTLRVKAPQGAAANPAVAARIYARSGVQSDSGVTLRATDQLLFPTSVVLVPEQPLLTTTVYTASLRATVNGRIVTRTWDFTTSN